ncbi:MAG: 3-phosphoshikimate 1-carboxyvinyltransferase [Bacteroidota bacterium]
MSSVTIHPAAALAGTVALPPDKSVAHRTAILAALGEGESEIVGYSDAADPQSTLGCLRQLGVEMEERDDALFIQGVGLRGLTAPSEPLDCGNSGTTMRLLSGVLAGQSFDTELIGDASLTPRPMSRIASPLTQMGAAIELTDGHAPIRISGRSLSPITYRLPMASAQVKSAVLLAGLYADGVTTVEEPVATRDHTERMLELATFTVGTERHISVTGGTAIPSRLWVVPKDISAAAFFLVAGSIAQEAILKIQRVGLNPTRSAVVDVLRAMGASITRSNARERGGEPLADLQVQTSGGLTAVDIGGDIIPNLIDEIPVLAVAAAYATGRTVIRDAEELRVKETDRIAATAAFLRSMGAQIEERPDGLVIDGGQPLHGAEVDAMHDHRIAMAAAVAALGATGSTVIHGAEAAAVSFPGFWDVLESIAPGSVEA